MVNNESLKFLLPLIGDKSPNFYFNKNFVGCFIGDKDKPNVDGSLLLVYKYPRTKNWINYEEAIRDISTYNYDYDYYDKEYVIYVFNLDEYEEDFNNIIEGKYSKISPENKLKISKFWEQYANTVIPKRIMDKDEKLKDNWLSWKKKPEDYCAKGELWFKPDINKEILNKNKEY